MKLSDYLVTLLASVKIHHVFQVIGGASVHMVHSLQDNKDVEIVCVQHEQAGAMAAESYARMTKNIGAAMATSGPGMTNLITGIGCAYFDSTPVLYITGQVNRNESKNGRKVRQVGFQETDIVEMVTPLTKYATRVMNPADIRYEFEKAIHIARSGRPGPVLLDIPMDLQRAEVQPKNLRPYDPSEYLLDYDAEAEVELNVSLALDVIAHAKRPVLIAGGGIRYADQTVVFQKLVNNLHIPVVATWSGIDTLSHDHDLYRGQIGVYGNRGANFTVQNSDCILALGTRLDTRITGGKPETFAPRAKKIIVDIDRSELYKKRGLDPDIGICADVRTVMPEFLKNTSKIHHASQSWLSRSARWCKKYPAVLPKWRTRKDKVDPYYFIESLSNTIPNNSLIVTDTGATLCWTIQAFHVQGTQRLWSAMGNSPMGYSVAAGMGALFADPSRPVISIIGDGGFQINIQELQTVVQYNIPLKIFILNNHSYGIIKQFQDVFFDSRHIATEPRSGYGMPNFIKVGTAYGIKSETIANHDQVTSTIKRVMHANEPVLVDVLVPDGKWIIPKLEFGKPIEDLSPLLPRTEFKKQMRVSVKA